MIGLVGCLFILVGVALLVGKDRTLALVPHYKGFFLCRQAILLLLWFALWVFYRVHLSDYLVRSGSHTNQEVLWYALSSLGFSFFKEVWGGITFVTPNFRRPDKVSFRLLAPCSLYSSIWTSLKTQAPLGSWITPIFSHSRLGSYPKSEIVFVSARSLSSWSITRLIAISL